MAQSTPTARKCEDHSSTDTKSTATSAPSTAPKRTIRVLEGPHASADNDRGWGRHEAAKLLRGEAVPVQVGFSTSTSSPQLKFFHAVDPSQLDVTIGLLPVFAPLTWTVSSDAERTKTATDDKNTVDSQSLDAAT